MSDRFALIVAIDDYADAPPLEGSRNDARDLVRTLLRRGVPPHAIRVLASPKFTAGELPGLPSDALRDATTADLAEGAAWLADALGTEDDAAWIHFSGRGTALADGTPALLLADDADGGGRAALPELLGAFADRPIRSVFLTLDAGFCGSAEASRALPGGAPAPLLAEDPMVTANGLVGPVPERALGGEPRGLLSWALARALEAAPRGADWTFGDLLAIVRRALDGQPAQPTLNPAEAAFLPIGALLDPGPAHVPWRGVHAAWQLNEEHGVISGGGNSGTFIVGGSPSRETWTWASNPWPTNNFAVTVQSLVPGDPGPGTTFRFSNNGFAPSGSTTPPQISANDRIYQVTVPGANGQQVWLIVRNVANPTSVDWYTTLANTPYLPVSVSDVLQFQGRSSLPPSWSQSTWYPAIESRQP